MLQGPPCHPGLIKAFGGSGALRRVQVGGSKLGAVGATPKPLCTLCHAPDLPMKARMLGLAFVLVFRPLQQSLVQNQPNAAALFVSEQEWGCRSE